MKWNEQQELAIDTCYTDGQKRCNLLVNAAAGSGKTAVLVERIIRKIEKKGGSDIDRLLVVTFTKAAAAEMQQKINRALVARMENPHLSEADSAHLMRQLRLLSGSDICNIDSYCIRVVRNNFHILGIDPNFSPVSGAELEIMKDEAITLLFEELYENDEETEFVRLAELFSKTGDDSGLAEIIKVLYDFTTSLPDPQGWFDKIIERIGGVSLEDSFEGIKTDITEAADKLMCTAAVSIMLLSDEGFDAKGYSVDELMAMAQKVIEDNKAEDNPIALCWGNVWNLVVEDFTTVYALYNAAWHEMRSIAQKFGFSSFPTAIDKIKYKADKKLKKSEAKAEEIKRADNEKLFLRLRAGHEFLKTKSVEFYNTLTSSPMDEVRIVKEITNNDTYQICRLVMLFADKLYTLKQRRGVLEFCDIERLVYKLMVEHPEIRREYNERYDEVLIDEYQDVNALQDAIFTLISRGDNMFMVGDMKQSIYRFRNSDPTIFKHKTDTYKDEYNRVINLNRNYRSRENVLESINNVFSLIMSEGAGEINYDDTQRLNAGDLNYDDVNSGKTTDNRSELVLVRRNEDSQMSAEEAEAKYVAEKIRSMIDSGFKVRRSVVDEDGNQSFIYDNVRPRDFVILSSSLKGLVDIYTEALDREGLLCYAETGGYFDKSEIMAVMSVIKAIDNPQNDIPLVATMRLPVCGFSDDELAELRLASRGCMYNCLSAMKIADTPLGEKCRRFCDMLDHWRYCSRIMSCDKLIWTIYEETDLYAYYGTLDNGEEAQANLRMLFERAKDFENTGFKGLFNFIRFIEKLESHSSDYSEAKLISEEHDVVRMMTMHKSKGLEFPVVFIVKATRRFRFDEGKNLCYHKDKGIGLAYVNYDMRYCVPTILTREIERCNRFESISECMRLWYVGMTRAKEKLIITAPEKAGIQELSFMEGADNSATVNKARSFFEWLAPIARADKLWKYSELIIYDGEGESSATAEKSITLEIGDKTAMLDWQYEHIKSTLSPAKISVTELKRRKMLADIMDDDARQTYKTARVRKKPFFITENEPLTGAERGTVVHYIMQTMPLDADEADVKKHIESLVQSGKLTKREAECADSEKLIAFLKTDLAARMRRSESVMREVPFEFAVPSEEVYGFDGDDVIIQGIIDCFFEEDGEIVLLDFKTDYYKEGNGAELAEKYKIQLDNYARAIEKITKKHVKNKYLYLFLHNDVVECI